MKNLSKLACYSLFFLSSAVTSTELIYTSPDNITAQSALDTTDITAQADFIGRLYLNTLNRVADQDGLDTWLGVIQSESSAKVALGFFNSSEFINLQLNNSDFVNLLYATLFDRLADEDGLNNWITVLETGTFREFVIYDFLTSPEFTNQASELNTTTFSEKDNKLFQVKRFVRRFYQTVLGRAADINGFNVWSTQLSKGRKSGGEIAIEFFNSPEFLNRSATDNEFMDIAYRTFFDREADQAGKMSWLNQLSTGGTRTEVINGFIRSQEFINLASRFGIDANFDKFTTDFMQGQTLYMVNEDLFEMYTWVFQETDYIIYEDPDGPNNPSSLTIDDQGLFSIDNKGFISLFRDENRTSYTILPPFFDEMGRSDMPSVLKLKSSPNSDFLQVQIKNDVHLWVNFTEQFSSQFKNINELKNYFLTHGLLETSITSNGKVRRYHSNTLIEGKWWVEDNIFFFDYPNSNNGGLDSRAYKVENNEVFYAIDAVYSHNTRMYFDEIEAIDYLNTIYSTAQDLARTKQLNSVSKELNLSHQQHQAIGASFNHKPAVNNQTGTTIEYTGTAIDTNSNGDLDEGDVVKLKISGGSIFTTDETDGISFIDNHQLTANDIASIEQDRSNPALIISNALSDSEPYKLKLVEALAEVLDNAASFEVFDNNSDSKLSVGDTLLVTQSPIDGSTSVNFHTLTQQELDRYLTLSSNIIRTTL